METAIPDARRVDGVPEVHVVEMPMESEAGYAHQMRIHADEHNVFGRTLLHSTEPGDGRMWATATRGEVGARTFVLIRKRNDVADSDLRAAINDRIGPALATVPGLTELRTQVFVPWSVESWDTPDVAHDYPEDTRYHASMVLGSPDEAALLAALQSSQVSAIADDIRSVASAVHALPGGGDIHLRPRRPAGVTRSRPQQGRPRDARAALSCSTSSSTDRDTFCRRPHLGPPATVGLRRL